MNGPCDTPLERWADRLEAELVDSCPAIAQRVMVIAETASTQDAARRHASADQSLLVVTGRQTGGRGRLGRAWLDDRGLGVAMTVAIPDRGVAASAISLAAGVAAAEACAALSPRSRIGLKWPNDVVDVGAGGKLSGLLVERADGVLLVGIGVNVNQRETDWRDQPGAAVSPSCPPVSLAQLRGEPVDRLEVLVAIVRRLSAELTADEAQTIARWRRRDVLTGTIAAFESGGVVHRGVVESIDPTMTLLVRTVDGLVRLPALSTSVLKESNEPSPGPA